MLWQDSNFLELMPNLETTLYQYLWNVSVNSWLCSRSPEVWSDNFLRLTLQMQRSLGKEGIFFWLFQIFLCQVTHRFEHSCVHCFYTVPCWTLFPSLCIVKNIHNHYFLTQLLSLWEHFVSILMSYSYSYPYLFSLSAEQFLYFSYWPIRIVSMVTLNFFSSYKSIPSFSYNIA